MICTRDIPVQAESGRERTMAFILRTLCVHGEVEIFRLHSLLEQFSVRRLATVLWTGFCGVLCGKPVPLQSLLFHDSRYARTLDHVIARFRPDAVYFDGVRSGLHAVVLRRAYPSLSLVCDFDDLMSRRMEVLMETRQPISLGYLGKLAPTWVLRYVLDGMVARLVQAYEYRALCNAESRISTVCNKIVLVSSLDAARLQQQQPGVPVAVIPPYVQLQRSLQPLSSIERFVFIGSDSLLQNRLTIQYLISLWQRLNPATELHIFGRMSDYCSPISSVVFRGFVPDVAEAYETGSVLLAPSFIGGGVKTKVLEAISYGIIPVGTAITFEGIDAEYGALTLSPTDLEDLIIDPTKWLLRLNEAGAVLANSIFENHSASKLGDCWGSVIWPEHELENQK